MGVHFLTIFAALLSCLVGCATTPKAPDRTGGVTVDMEVRKQENSIARYVVQPDGTLTFAGGKSALFGNKADWTGSLTDEEAAQIRVIIKNNNLFQADLTSTNEPPDLQYTLQLSGGPGSFLTGGSRTIKLIGSHPAIDPLAEILFLAAARRNEAVLNKLPQPSIETIGK